MSRRAESVLGLIRTEKELQRAIEAVPDYTGQYTPESYYEDEKAAYDAAVAEYESAHATTADEVKRYLINHPDTTVSAIQSDPHSDPSEHTEWLDDRMAQVHEVPR